MKKSAASLAYFDRQSALQDSRKAANTKTVRAPARSYSSPRKKSCITGGNCSSFATGRSCGGHDCDGWS